MADENKYSAVGSVSFRAAVSIFRLLQHETACMDKLPFSSPLLLLSCTIFFFRPCVRVNEGEDFGYGGSLKAPCATKEEVSLSPGEKNCN